MSKRIFFVLITILLIGCKKDKNGEIETEKIINDRESFNLVGNVKMLKHESFLFSEDRSSLISGSRKSSEHNYTLSFDENGRLIKEVKFLPDGKIHEETEFNGKDKKLLTNQYLNGTLFISTKFTQDENGNNINITRRNAQNEIIDKTVQTFRDNQMIEKKVFNGAEKLLSKVLYEYDTAGNLIREQYFNTNNQPTHQIKYGYDKQNNKVYETHATADDKHVSHTKFQYENGLLTGMEVFTDQEEPVYKEIKEYDNAGRLTYNKISDFNADESSEERIVYDEAGNLTGSETYINDKKVLETKHIYDEKNMLIEKSVTDKKGDTKTERYQYTFDVSGNWISKTTFLNDNPVSEIKRNIEY